MKLENLITQKETFKILSAHGWSPDQPTAINPETLAPIAGTSFVDSFGTFAMYDKNALYSWLGY